MTRWVRLLVGVLAAFAVLFLTAGPASAHAVLLGSDPRDGADLARAPAQVSITFDEAVGLRPGYLQVIDGTGRRVDAGSAFHPVGRDDVVTVRLRPGLGRAAYLASYRVISADSHPVSGSVQFTVGGAAPTAIRPKTRGTDPVVSAVFDAARSVTFLGLALFGGAWLLLFARRHSDRDRDADGDPDRDRDPDRDADPSPDRDRNPDGDRGTDARAEPSRWWLGVLGGAVLAMCGLAAEFLCQGPYAAAARLTAVTEPSLLADTVSSSFGRWHLIAIVLLAGLGAAALRASRSGRSPRVGSGPAVDTARPTEGPVPGPVVSPASGPAVDTARPTGGPAEGPAVGTAALGAVGSVLCAAAWVVVLIAVAESGHAGVRSPVWLGLPVTVAHLLAMTTWLGGLAVLILVLSKPSARQAGRADASHAFARVLPVFSRVAMVCVATLAVTGTYQAWQEVGSWSALFDTTYGELVLTKIELFAVLIALGALARARVAAWPTGSDPADSAQVPRRVAASSQLRGGIIVELVVAVAILCVSGVLVAEPPGRDSGMHSAMMGASMTASSSVTAPLSSTRTVTVRVTPGQHGPVAVEVTLSRGPAVQELTVTATQLAAGVGPLPVVVRATAGRFRSGRVDLPIAGDWQFSVTVQTSQFDIVTATPTLHLS